MFYCEACAIKNQWPRDFYLPMSRGGCEICGERAVCFDVPSSHLAPVQPVGAAEKQASAEVGE